MGGHALKIETKRLSTADFLLVEAELTPRIKNLFNTEIHIVKYFHTKESHGDMDILILNNGNLGNIADKIKNEFNPQDIHSNGGVYSFDYKDFQIDIIPQPTRNWQTGKDFFDYDPTGNIMGKYAHKFGLKYGFEGLTFPYRYKGLITEDIIISKDSHKIFEFLGFDYNRYLKGFETKQEIFEFCTNNKYFNKENFLFENLNSIDKKRNRKRKTYNEFLEYINTNNFENNHKFKRDKRDYIAEIETFFPEAKLIHNISKLIKSMKMNELRKEKFSGDIIMKMFPNLQGKELGDFIKNFKNKIENSGIKFNDYLDGYSKNDINIDIKQFYFSK